MLKKLKQIPIGKFIIYSAYGLFTLSVLGWLTFTHWPTLESHDHYWILMYLLISILINSMPLKIGPIFITFNLIVSIAVFLKYGVVAETWITLIAFLITMLVGPERRPFKRIFLTNMMFIWISLISAYVYYAVGGEIDYTREEIFNYLFPIIAYTITYFVANHFILYFYRQFFLNIKASLLSEDMIWDAITLLLTLPFGLMMYYGYRLNPFLGVMVVAIPILVISQLFKLYSELRQSHQQLSALNKISASFTTELNFDKTIIALQQAIREILNFDNSYIFQKNGARLKLISAENYYGENLFDEVNPKFEINLGEGLTGKVAISKEGSIAGNDVDIYQLEVEPDFTQSHHSLLSVPIIWHNEVLGVITLGSSNEYHFSKKDLTLAKILASQAAVAIQNALAYKKTEQKSRTDELTGLYNYRAFDELLQKKFEEAEQRGEPLSLLVIDLDHFKQVNDHFGHLIGNEVLKIIAEILKRYTRKQDIVARYGGEEFTLIITDADHHQAEEIAERIRSAIQHQHIKVKDAINGKGEVLLNITASIGIASYPEKASSPKDLVRHADLAMYVGSKQGGRNRVSIYDAG